MANKVKVFSSTPKITVAPVQEPKDVPAAIPEETRAQFRTMVDNYAKALAEQTEARLGSGIEQGGPVVGIEMWDIACIQPIQTINPPWGALRPHNIISGTGNEWVALTAYLFVNPTPLPGGFPTATQYLGGRSCNVTFQVNNLTTWGVEFSLPIPFTFPAIANTITPFVVWYNPADPGPIPSLMELHVTADLVDRAQPFAAFATQWLNIEGDPGWPVPMPGGWQYQAPLKFLVYQR